MPKMTAWFAARKLIGSENEPGHELVDMQLQTLNYELRGSHVASEKSEFIVAFQGFSQQNSNFEAPNRVLPDYTLHDLALFGLVATSIMLVRNIRGAMLLGIIFTTLAGLAFGLVNYKGFVSTPPSMSPTFFKLDIVGALSFDLLIVIFTFFIHLNLTSQ